MVPEVAKELPVAVSPNGKKKSPNALDPAPGISTHPVPATPVKRIRTRVVKTPQRFKGLIS